MPILTGDLKILASDTMDDTDQGGGSVTSNVIIDGQSNNIFEDISTLDRVYGAVKMRKVFASVFTQNVDKYFGSHLIISKLPKDEKIGVNLFNTNDWFDRRPEAQTRVENYRAIGGKYNGNLWSTQYTDSKVINIFQNESALVPSIGDVMYISSSGNTNKFQYIKIVDVTESLQTYNDSKGEYVKRIINLEISQVLKHDFVGADVQRDEIVSDGILNNTVVTNASKYYSARPLSLKADVTNNSVKVDSVYSQVIPSSLQELAILDADANSNTIPVIESASDVVNFYLQGQHDVGDSLYLGSGCKPGSLILLYDSGSIKYIDKGGQVIIDDGTLTSVGTINYLTGVVTFKSYAYFNSSNNSFIPASAPSTVADTTMLPVSDGNRGYIWNVNIFPPPKPRSLKVSYIALGEWYDLFDDGSGKISGAENGIGSGSVDYVTGTASITLSALPDVGSAIVWSWGKEAKFTNRSSLASNVSELRFLLSLDDLQKGSLAITWNDGTPRTASSNINGIISGDATGSVDAKSGEVILIPNVLPLGGQEFSFDFYSENALVYQINDTPVSGNLTLTLPDTGIIPNSVSITWKTEVLKNNGNGSVGSYVARDTIAINTKYDDGIGGIGGVGTINYATGVIVMPTNADQNVVVATYEDHTAFWLEGEYKRLAFTGYTKESRSGNLVYPDPINSVRYRTTDTPSIANDLKTLQALVVDLTKGFDEYTVEGSVRFTLGGRTYVDRSGSLFYDINSATGAGVYGGTINYNTGQALVTDFNELANNSVIVESLLTSVSITPISSLEFKIPNPPIKLQSLQLRFNLYEDGSLVTGSSNADSTITGTNVEGTIDYENGLVVIRFGQWLLVAGNESEPWYNIDNIDPNNSSYVWKTDMVDASTLLYNATSQTFLPLDETILGLNPVRLPQDGRIPIYADGDVVVILNDNETIDANPVNTNSFQLLNSSDNSVRGRLAKVSVRDSANNLIADSAYTIDLDTGIFVWNDTSGVSAPVVITDRIEDMAILTDVQITGTLGLSQPLTHNFPLENTLVSNAVIFGDMFAYTTVPFDQQTWTNVWSNSLIGNNVTAQFNQVQNPIIVDNASAIQERWVLIFTSSTTVNVIGEHVGQILSGVLIANDIAPINPNTSQPYFTIPFNGWGGGWSAGNVLRFNTVAGNAGSWIVESIGQGEATDTDYNFCIELRGDIDTIV